MKQIKRIFLISFLVKLIIASILPLGSDEAYYWIWSNNLRLSYFDHPPFISWVVYLGHAFPEWGLRWPAILLSHIGLIGFILFLKELHFSDEKIKRWLLCFLFFPLTGFAGIILTPDLPLLAFIGWAAYFFIKAINKKNILSYLLFGIFFGLGMSSKYHMVIFGSGLIVALLTNKELKRSLKLQGLLITVLFSIIGFSPVIIWNYQNDWASFVFQAQHGLGKKSWNISIPLMYVLGQFLILTPIYWGSVFKTLKLKSFSLLYCLSFFPIMFFLISSFRKHVELNWTNIAFPFLFALIIENTSDQKLEKYFSGFYSLLYAIIISHWLFQWIPNATGKLNEPFEYQALVEPAKSLSPIYAGSYQMASSLSWQIKKPIYKLPGIRRYDFFDTLKTKSDIESHFYLMKESWVNLPEWVSNSCQSRIDKTIGSDYELWTIRCTDTN